MISADEEMYQIGQRKFMYFKEKDKLLNFLKENSKKDGKKGTLK